MTPHLTSTDTCRDEAGLLAPIVDYNRCEAKGPCIDVCPYDVFELKEISRVDLDALSFTGRVKTWVHGRKKAIVVRPESCHSCGLCVTACPEKAIKLGRVEKR